MSAKKIAAEKATAAKKPAAETPAADAPDVGNPAETPAADAPDVETPDSAVLGARKKKKQTVAEFVDALLSEHFTPQIVEFWGPQVVDNVKRGIPVTITESAEGAPLIGIRYGHSYRGAAEKSTEAGIHIDVNSAILAKFPIE